MIEWTMSGTCKALKDVPKDAIINAVNGRYVVGHCEGCGRYILEGQRYQSGPEAEMTCLDCGDKSIRFHG